MTCKPGEHCPDHVAQCDRCNGLLATQSKIDGQAFVNLNIPSSAMYDHGEKQATPLCANRSEHRSTK